MKARRPAALIFNIDTLAGIVFLVLAVGFGFLSLTELEIGVPARMGPGFMPLASSIGLGVVGLIQLGKGLRQAATPSLAPLRALILIPASMIAFAVLNSGLGFVASCFICVVAASLAAPGSRWLPSLTLALVMTAFCVGIFKFAMGMQAPLVGNWLTGG